MTDLTKLPNIGEKLAKELSKAGITTAGQLSKLGSVQTALLITRGKTHTGYNLLYALEGAILGKRWHSIDKEHLKKIKKEYDQQRTE